LKEKTKKEKGEGEIPAPHSNFPSITRRGKDWEKRAAAAQMPLTKERGEELSMLTLIAFKKGVSE